MRKFEIDTNSILATPGCKAGEMMNQEGELTKDDAHLIKLKSEYSTSTYYDLSKKVSLSKIPNRMGRLLKPKNHFIGNSIGCGKKENPPISNF